jgi:hypothetical protein
MNAVVLDDGEVTDDLRRDMAEFLTSFCARLYHRARRATEPRDGPALSCAVPSGTSVPWRCHTHPAWLRGEDEIP